MTTNKGVITKKVFLTEDVVEFTIETNEVFKFQAGQYISVKICDNPKKPCFRAYSVASVPQKNSKTFQLCIKLIENGRASEWFKRIKEGTEIEFLGPIGKFVFQKDKKTALFIAVGTGITPLKSMIEDELKNGNNQKMHLLFGLRYIKGIFYKDFFEELSGKYQNFKFDLTLSQPENPSWKGKIGRVTNLLKNMKVDTKNTCAYLCGFKEMVEDTKKILLEKGVPEKEIHFEKF